MKQLQFTLLAFTVGALAAGFASGQAVPASEGSPLQHAADPVMGDWQGEALCARVIALGKGAYQANLLEAFDTRAPLVAVLKGETTDDGVVFKGEADGVKYSGAIQDDEFKGAIAGGKTGVFSMKKAARLSPTLGVKPPEGAVVLFDGTDADEWVHPVRNLWELKLDRAIGGENRVAYLRTKVWSPAKQEATLEIGSDDGVKVWLNEEVVHAKNVLRGVKPGEDKIAIRLQKGWNPLMLKVTQGAGGWGACARLRDAAGGDLKGIRVAIDQTDPDKAATLEATKGYVMHWEVSGPFSSEGKDATALFDVVFAPEEGGKCDWESMPTPSGEEEPCHWLLLDNGAMEVSGGGIVSKRRFTDHKLHIEFRLPLMADKRGQARANSGVYVQGRYELQILDSYGLEARDNECGGIYKVAQPDVNMCAPPLQWQTYDITFHAPRFDGSGNKTKDAVMTVLHNGVPIHEDLILPAPTPGGVDYDAKKPGGVYLQDHGNPLWFRNIWAVELDGQDR